MKYRAEIDGLRAIAVVPVILFHAGFDLFSGGFVGVDVFFVISGYLITTILIEDIENKRFSIINFYERRARRILPALFLVMFLCIPIAWMWMYSQQMEDFSQSLMAVSLFASNILFWRESGYFDSAAEEKPLLHTWSLAVEEQYYLLFPIFLILTWRFGRHRVFWMIIAMAVISFLLSEWGWRNKASANFYLAPTRAWELFAGSIAAFITYKNGVKKNNALALVGLLAIVIAIFLYDKFTPFPSLYTLVPVIGVFLLITFGEKETIVAKILSVKAFIGIGLISYSAYLWHQPLFAFARVIADEHPSPFQMSILAVGSFLIAYLSWRFIERPFRSAKTISRKGIAVFSLLGLSVFFLIGLFGHYKNGFSIQYAEQLIVDKNNLITVNMPIYVIGDSHAEHLVSGLIALNNSPVIDMTRPGCIPFRNVDRYDSRSQVGACVETMNRHLDTLKEIDSRAVVILSSMGPVYLDGTPFNGKDYARVTGMGVELMSDKTITNHYEIYEIGMRQTLAELSANPNLTIIFTVDIPELGIDNGCQNKGKRLTVAGFEIRDFISTDAFDVENCFVSRIEYNQRTVRYKELVYKVLEDYSKSFIFDPTEYFCNFDSCSGYINDFGYLYRDVDHLSLNGSLFYADRLYGHFEFFPK